MRNRTTLVKTMSSRGHEDSHPAGPREEYKYVCSPRSMACTIFCQSIKLAKVIRYTRESHFLRARQLQLPPCCLPPAKLVYGFPTATSCTCTGETSTQNAKSFQLSATG